MVHRWHPHALFMLAALAGLAGLAGFAAVAPAQTVPEGFLIEDAFPTASWALPVQVVFMPDGRKLVVEKEGRVWVVTGAGTKLTTPFLDISAKVLSDDDRGLHGVALDPDFASNRWVYFLYTVDPDSNGVDDNITAYGRVERYQTSLANPNVIDPTTRQVLIGTNMATGIPEPCRNMHHMVGTLRFGSDKTLFVGSGDGANADITDSGGTDPSFGAGQIDPAQNLGAFRAQTLNSMNGKILRIDKETGLGLPSNPYWNGTGTASRSRVWLYGLRNPFRFSLRPGTGGTDPSLGQPGVLYVGDVGWNTTEELDIARQGGFNYGWPCKEGPYDQPLYQAVTSTAYANPNVLCGAPTSTENPAVKTPPVLWWDHVNGAQSNPPGVVGACAIGGAFYTGTIYPPSYQNRYYVADFVGGWIRQVQVDASDNVVSTGDFITGAGGVMDIETDPANGDLYYIDINTSRIFHVRYLTGNFPPVVVASINPTFGIEPLTVTATASGSSDPDHDPLGFLWAFGDGGTSTAADTTYTYATPGSYTASVTVTDGHGGSTQKVFQVVVGQTAPPGQILLPVDRSFFNQGDTVNLAATPVDTTQGPAAYRWDIDLAHNTHVHPSTQVFYGPNASFVATTPNDGETYHLRIRLGVTQGALTSVDTVNIYPKVNLSAASIAFTPPAPTPTAAFLVTGVVRSTAEIGSPPASWQVLEGAVVLASGSLPPVANGDSLAVSATVGPLPFGQHTLRFRFDSANDIVETDETDNDAVGTVSVRGLIAGYPFDEGSGTTTADVSGHGLTGTLVNATWAASGKYGRAVSLNGSSGYVDLGNPVALQVTSSMTWSAWVNASANPADDGIIVGKSDDNSGWQLKTTPDTGPHTFGITISGATGSHTQRYSTTVRSLNTWYHVAGVYDATARTLDIYVNGALANGTLLGTVPASQVAPAVNVNIGRRTGGFYFGGMIDDVRIYDRALTQAEIAADMATPLGTPPPPPPPPAVPVLASPANLATGVSTSPTLSWNAASGAATYRLQVSTDAAFSAIVADQAGLVATSTTLASLAGNTLYYWHVNATNTTGTSAYSTAWSFTTAAPPPPPAVPTLASPANLATGVPTTPTLAWNAASGAATYRVQVATDAGFGTIVADQAGLVATSATLASALSASTVYYWHVNASNSVGPSAYSAAWSFTTAAAPPPSTALAAYAFDEGSGTTTADVSGHGLTGTLVNATWAASGKYGKAVSLNGSSGYVDLGNPAALQVTGSMTWSAWVNASANPADDGIIVGKSDDNSGWQLKTTPDTGPHTFGITISGSTGSHTQRYSTTVRALNTWYHVAGVYDATARTLDIYVNGALANGTLSGTVPASQVAPAVNVNIGRRTGGFYFGGMIDDVRIYDRALTQAEIAADMATPLGTPPPPPPLPAVPVLALPANLATGVSTSPTLSWNAASGAATYRVQVATDAAFSAIVADQAGLVATSTTLASLAGNTLYYWHVNATNTTGTSAYSTAWSFTTAAPPPPPAVPTLASPANLATGVPTTPTLAWNAASGAATYRVQVATDAGFGTIVADQAGLVATSATLASALSASTVYYWHVNASNSVGPSAYSAAWSFTTAAAPPPSTALAAYAFDEGSGTTTADVSGHGLTGTLVNATWAASGKYGKAVMLNGSSGYVDLGNPVALQVTGSMTWSAWVNASANPADDGIIVGKSDDNSGWQLKTTPDTGPHTFGITISGSTGSHTQRYSTTVRSLNTWYHVAGVYDATARTLDIYVNGALANGTLSGTVPASQVAPAVNVNIGRRTGGFYFGGMIDDVRIYDRALTQAEIAADMATPAGTPPPPPPPPAVPVLASPANLATGVSTSPTLSWNAASNAASYRVQVATDAAFGTIVADQSNLAATSTVVGPLSANTLYYWHVNATNATSTSAYSTTWSFTTAAAPPPSTALAAYAFDEGSGTTTADVSGHGLTGTLVNATWAASGKYGKAVSLNGSSGYVDLGNPVALQVTGSMTWSAWVNASANPADDGIIVGKSDDNSGWQLKTTPDTGPHTFGITISGSTGSHTQRYSTTVRSLNTWYHVAGVYDATARTLDIYVNGALANGTLSGTVPASQVAPAVNVNIGRRTGGFYFGGMIDDVRIYDRALTQAEIAADMATPAGTLPAPAAQAEPAAGDASAAPAQLPVVYALALASANPARGASDIALSVRLPRDEQVKLEVFDVAGHRVALLVDAYRPAGSFLEHLDTSGLRSGIYLARLAAGPYAATRKIVLMK